MTQSVPHRTAAQLGIGEKTLEALLWVRNQLATGRVQHDCPATIDQHVPHKERDPNYKFNMRYYEANHPCGTTCCIGGMMRVYLGDQDIHFGLASDDWHTLGPLFKPAAICCNDWYNISSDATVEAIDNLLLLGDPNWGDIADKYGYKKLPLFERC